MGWITLVSLLTNIYTVLLLRRMEAGQSVANSSNKNTPRFPSGYAKKANNANAADTASARGRRGGKGKDSNDPQSAEVTAAAPWPKPNGWEAYGFYKTRHHFKCKNHSHDRTKPLPSLQDWQFLRDRYKEIITEDLVTTFDDPVPPTMGYSLGKDAGPAPFYAAFSEKGGRGLFASRDIAKGELVLDGDRSDFVFPNAMAWRRYVFSLPRTKACDVIDWCWTQRTEARGKYQIFSSMNISVLLNGGDEKDQNVNPISSTDTKMYAARDIKKDEELLTDYDIYDTVWGKVGLGGDDDDDEYGTDDDDDDKDNDDDEGNDKDDGDDDDDDDDRDYKRAKIPRSQQHGENTTQQKVSSFQEDTKQKNQAQVIEFGRFAVDKKIKERDAEKRTEHANLAEAVEDNKRAILAHAVEDEMFELVKKLEGLIGKQYGVDGFENLPKEAKWKAVEKAKQTKLLQGHYNDLVNGRPSQLLERSGIAAKI